MTTAEWDALIVLILQGYCHSSLINKHIGLIGIIHVCTLPIDMNVHVYEHQ